MSQVCIYLQLHQPLRLQDYNVFDVGNSVSYFSGKTADLNRDVFKKVSKKSYLPMLKLLKKLIKKHDGFVFSLSASGIFLEQAQEYQPEVLELLKDLVKTDRVEFLAETYYHSLAFLYSKKEYLIQIKKHGDLIEKLFGKKPKVFRNTELIYSNEVAETIANLGYVGMLTEAVEPFLGGRKKTQLFESYSLSKIPLLLKHAELSDDVAFRFGDKNWQWHPLTVDKYLDWVEIYDEDEIINLFMDFETFGEHQWEDTGIFDFFEHFVARFEERNWDKFITPTQAFSKINKNENLPTYDVPRYISWADVDRDITAWRGNDLQSDALRVLYSMEEKVLASKDKNLIRDWRYLQTSDHFYYMCTKWSDDGDIHAYFSPYSDPYEAYRRYSVVLADLHERLL